MHTITLPAQVASLPEALALVTGYAAEAGCPPARLREIELAVEEALANICLYAYPDSTGDVVVRCALLEQGALLIELSDAGVPFDPTASPTPDLSVDPTERLVGGLGLVFVRTLMETVTYQREGGRNILRLTARLQP